MISIAPSLIQALDWHFRSLPVGAVDWTLRDIIIPSAEIKLRGRGKDSHTVAVAFPSINFLDWGTWGSFLIKSSASPCTSTNSLAPDTTSFVSCLWSLALCPQDATATLVHAFVTSRPDQCSSVLVGLPLYLIARLDRVLRWAARLVERIPKYGSVTAYILDTLHWFSVAQRISYPVAVLVWRRLLGSAPWNMELLLLSNFA